MDVKLGKVMRIWHSATAREHQGGGNMRDAAVRISENRGITRTLQRSVNKEPRDLPQYLVE